MKNKCFIYFSAVTCLIGFNTGYAGEIESSFSSFHPSVYAEYAIGAGGTSWPQLAHDDSGPDSLDNGGLNVSVPINAVDENLDVYGAILGYQPSENFAFEISYLRFPDSKLLMSSVYFTPDILYTESSEYTLMAKVIGRMTHRIPLFAYATAGMQAIHRDDNTSALAIGFSPPILIQVNLWHINPAFGFGFMYNVTQHWVIDLAFRFNVGFGRSELIPMKDYVPFLYSGTFRFGYRIIL